MSLLIGLSFDSWQREVEEAGEEEVGLNFEGGRDGGLWLW